MRTRSLMSSREEANPEGSGLQSRFSVLFVFSDNPPPPTHTHVSSRTLKLPGCEEAGEGGMRGSTTVESTQGAGTRARRGPPELSTRILPEPGARSAAQPLDVWPPSVLLNPEAGAGSWRASGFRAAEADDIETLILCGGGGGARGAGGLGLPLRPVGSVGLHHRPPTSCCLYPVPREAGAQTATEMRRVGHHQARPGPGCVNS